MIPRSRGGTDHLDKLQLLCGWYNRVKGDRTPEYLAARPAKMPTMKELFEELRPLIGQVDGFSPEAYQHADDNVETLLSYYAIRSPCDDSIEVLRKQRVAEILVRKIADHLWTREELGASDGLNPNGEKLVDSQTAKSCADGTCRQVGQTAKSCADGKLRYVGGKDGQCDVE